MATAIALRVLLPLAITLSAIAIGHAADRCAAHADFPNPRLLKTMQRGVNMPSWDLPDTFADASRKPLRALRDEGFTHIRLPLDNEQLAPDSNAAYLSKIYEQTIYLMSLGYTVSLDLHAGSAAAASFERGREAGVTALADMWVPLARMASGTDPGKVALELLNEPGIGQDDWMYAAGRLVEILRPIVPNHTLIVGPSGPQRHETLSGMRPLPDPNIIYAVHYYDPFYFTHQGANWGPPDDPLRLFKGLPFPAEIDDTAIVKAKERLKNKGEMGAVRLLNDSLGDPWDAKMVDRAFTTMSNWANKYKRPVIINEFGALTFVAPRQSRLRWLSTVNALAYEHCLGWVHWDFKDGFALVDRDTDLPDPGVLDALTNMACQRELNCR